MAATASWPRRSPGGSARISGDAGVSFRNEGEVLLEVAINGARTVTEHPAVPLTPEQQAREARGAVEQGAGAIHVHVRDAAGQESLAPDDVARALEAIRAACPGTPVGVSTGAWIVPDAGRRQALIRAWEVLPDFASVNLHEAGATDVVRLLADRGVGVEGGVWNAGAARILLESGLAGRCLRILLEPAEEPGDARVTLEAIERTLGRAGPSRLLHGLDASAWELVALAARRGYDSRVGFEDVLTLPDGSRAESNADLVAAARRIVAGGAPSRS
jgi:uncharacterized protein (DUF849 family)